MSAKRQKGRERKRTRRARSPQKPRDVRFVHPVPVETATAFAPFAARCCNPGLVFDRYIAYWDNWSLEPRKIGRDAVNPKFKNLRNVQNVPTDDELRQEFIKRWCKTVESVGAETFEAAPRWRFVTGLGRGGPLEVGFTFHRIYGFPIIPGSGLKGLTRAYALLMADEVQGETLDERQRDSLVVLVFGQQEGAGNAVFFDAVPMVPPKLELDVMNPHYPDYYQGNRLPDDGQNPRPVFFLTVGRETRFLFAVGGRGAQAEEAKHQAVKWLKAALTELGVGAKTSAGYGYLEVLDDGGG